MKIKVRIEYSVVDTREKELIFETDKCVNELDIQQVAKEAIQAEKGRMTGYGSPIVVNEETPVNVHLDPLISPSVTESQSIHEKYQIADELIAAMKEHGIGAIRSSEYIGENNVRDDVIALCGYINRSPWKLTIPISAIEETYCSRKQLGCLLACDSDCTGLFHVDTCMDGEHYYYYRID